MKNVKNLMALHPERKVGEDKVPFCRKIRESIEQAVSYPMLYAPLVFYAKSNMVNVKKELRKTEQSSDYNKKEAD